LAVLRGEEGEFTTLSVVLIIKASRATIQGMKKNAQEFGQPNPKKWKCKTFGFWSEIGCRQREKIDWQEQGKFDCWLVRTIFIFVVPRQFSQEIGEWPENKILIPDWTYHLNF